MEEEVKNKLPVCNYCGKDVIFKSKRVLNRYKQYPNKNYYCDKICYHKSMMNVIDIPEVYCAGCNKLLEKDRRVFGKSNFWKKEHHFCNVQCQTRYYNSRKKVSDEEKKKNWRKYNIIGWEKQRFREEILKENNYCKQCGSKEKLHIHHIKPAKLFPELFYNKLNILVLCIACHKEVHYGSRKLTV